jgi:hypothetical protein
MNTRAAARRWAETWERAWPERDTAAIAALYADGNVYRALAFREPTTAARYLPDTFESEQEIECRFGEPVVAGDRAAVEWWATWLEDGEPLTMAGATLLRFAADGLVVDHRDYWNETRGRRPPYDGWS